MDSVLIRKKFGDDYQADERAFTMGIDRRFTSHFAARFKDMIVLETCTGGGFSTIPLARTAKKVYTVDIDSSIQATAVKNIKKAGLSGKVEFLAGSIMSNDISGKLPPIDAAFLDPDWNIMGSDHIHHFLNSTTVPPADELLHRIFSITKNVALILPPTICEDEFQDLPAHERQSLYMGDSHELLCLYFGDLADSHSKTDFRVS